MTDISLGSDKKSTNVRIKSIRGGLRRGLVRAACVLAPEAMSRQAVTRFLTPPLPAHPDFPPHLLDKGYRFALDFGAQDLAAWSWGKGPAVLLVHGWGGRASQFSGFVEPLLEAGFRVVAMDFPAHGESTGRRTNLVDMAGALRTLSRRLGTVAGVVTHSMGAAAVAHAINDGFDTDRLVFVASPADMTEQSKRIAAQHGVTETVRFRMQRKIEDRLGVPWRHLNVPQAGRTAQSDLLVIHDREDRQVDWSDGVKIAQGWAGSRMVSTSGLGHNRILNDDDIIRQSVDFVLGL